MSEKPISIWREPAVRNYLFTGASALLVVMLAHMVRDAAIGGLLAVLVAVPGLVGRWSASPILFLLVSIFPILDPQGMLLIAPEYMGRGRDPVIPGLNTQTKNAFDITDLFLAAGMLCYLIAQYRLLSLMNRSFPPDRVPFHRPKADDESPKRPAKLVREDEIPFALALSSAFVLGGQIVWLLIWTFTGDDGNRSMFIGQTGAFVVVVWGLSVGLLISATVFGYLSMRNASHAEADMFLRDGVWQETYREQQRVHRWRIWNRARKGQ